MTCRNEVASMFNDKSRSDLLDYVCDRIDKNERDIEELLNKIKNSIKKHKEEDLQDDMLVILELDVIQWHLLLSYIEQLEEDKEILIRNNNIGNERLKELQNINKQLKHNRDKALKIIDSYELGKYDYSIPPGGITELREALKGDSDV